MMPVKSAQSKTHNGKLAKEFLTRLFEQGELLLPELLVGEADNALLGAFRR